MKHQKDIKSVVATQKSLDELLQQLHNYRKRHHGFTRHEWGMVEFALRDYTSHHSNSESMKMIAGFFAKEGRPASALRYFNIAKDLYLQQARDERARGHEKRAESMEEKAEQAYAEGHRAVDGTYISSQKTTRAVVFTVLLVFGFAFGTFLLSATITGNTVASASTTTMKVFGIIFILLGCVGLALFMERNRNT